jgi:RNA polymerase sigma-70 factor (ECF subfamily)
MRASLEDRQGWQLESVDPLEWLLADERKRMIQEAVDSLPGRDAEVLLLKYLENWRYREIAEHLGLTEKAVEARLHRARSRLRKRLKQLNVFEVPEVSGVSS